MNKENAIAKINKYGKIGKIITRIMLIVIGISMFATFISGIALQFLPEDIMTLNIGTQAELTVNPSLVSQDISEDVYDNVIKAVNNSVIKGGLNLGVISLKLDQAKRVDNKIVAYTNADNNGKVSLRKIGIAVLFAAFALVLTFISVIFGNKLCKAFEKCESPFSDDVISKMRKFAFSLIPWALYSSVPKYVVNSVFGNNLDTGISLDMNVIFAVLIILALTIVFKYGAILQKESDETL